MKHTFEIFSDQLDAILVAELEETLRDYELSLHNANRPGHSEGVFSWDIREEKKELKKTIKALKRVIAIWEA